MNSTLNHNLSAKQIDSAFARAFPEEEEEQGGRGDEEE